MLQVRIDGVRELTRAIARINPELAKELGQRNKAIGARIISRAEPKPVQSGAGRGAVPRASASRNVLRIMAGGAHRTHVPVQDWGIQQVFGDEPRPFIWRAAEQEIVRAMQDYLDALFDVARRAGLTARRG